MSKSDGFTIDCGHDDRKGNHSHIWMRPEDVAAYCNELQQGLSSLRAEVERLRAALEICEWVNETGTDYALCPECECDADEGHADGCSVAAALGRTTRSYDEIDAGGGA